MSPVAKFAGHDSCRVKAHEMMLAVNRDGLVCCDAFMTTCSIAEA